MLIITLNIYLTFWASTVDDTHITFIHPSKKQKSKQHLHFMLLIIYLIFTALQIETETVMYKSVSVGR